jgi:hypothetical protein
MDISTKKVAPIGAGETLIYQNWLISDKGV